MQFLAAAVGHFSSESWTRFRSPQNPGPAVPRARLPRTRKPGRRLPPPRGVDTAAGWRVTPRMLQGRARRLDARLRRVGRRHDGDRPAGRAGPGKVTPELARPALPPRVPGRSPAWTP